MNVIICIPSYKHRVSYLCTSTLLFANTTGVSSEHELLARCVQLPSKCHVSMSWLVCCDVMWSDWSFNPSLRANRSVGTIVEQFDTTLGTGSHHNILLHTDCSASHCHSQQIGWYCRWWCSALAHSGASSLYGKDSRACCTACVQTIYSSCYTEGRKL